jgi:hypothetical protein
MTRSLTGEGNFIPLSPHSCVPFTLFRTLGVLQTMIFPVVCLIPRVSYGSPVVHSLPVWCFPFFFFSSFLSYLFSRLHHQIDTHSITTTSCLWRASTLHRRSPFHLHHDDVLARRHRSASGANYRLLTTLPDVVACHHNQAALAVPFIPGRRRCSNNMRPTRVGQQSGR